MFLTDKYHALLPFHVAGGGDHRRKVSKKKPAGGGGPGSSRFGATLAARLGSLLPLPASPLAALARLADLLALTLADAVPALAGEGDTAAVAAHLDAGVALLDACNAITARLDRLRRRRLLTRFALHLLSSSSSPPPSSIRRARAALADRDERAPASPPPPLPSLPFDQPRARISSAASVLFAVDAVSSLAAAAAAAVLCGDALQIVFPLVSGDFPWTEAFNAVSSQLAALATKAGEVEAVDEAVRKLTSVLDSEGDLDEAAVRAAAQEVEKRTEELTAPLDRLSDAVNGVFRAALCLRNAELGSMMVGPAEKTPCK
ncbi:protein BPS1, chloroplastic-like [Oryza brachyantha]|uniref:protein BPS1, chloroplastic-like n=1 Tax=Oryza brachyantha TaxID=4533 RepID=UPI001AD9EB84|nr:protein BPS1, chloroplastic-like [Oryza brachyantha]